MTDTTLPSAGQTTLPDAGADTMIDVVLEGGPLDLPTGLRRRRARAADPTIKVAHRGGYEHFERVGEPAGVPARRQVVYCWTRRTKVAE
jgi:Family of unknown function (DUF5988)